MSKLIVEMDMPTRCGACKCRHVEFDTDYVAVFCGIKDNEYVEDPDSRPSWCPIKGELPDEHGDLIDRSLLCADLVGVILSHRGLGIDEVIARQSVIIAAERKEDEQIH